MRILTEPDASLCTQYTALLATEGLDIRFDHGGVRRIAEIAYPGQRAHREHRRPAPAHHDGAVCSKSVSFDAADRKGQTLAHRRRVRRRAPRRTGEGRGPQPLHSLAKLVLRYVTAIGEAGEETSGATQDLSGEIRTGGQVSQHRHRRRAFQGELNRPFARRLLPHAQLHEASAAATAAPNSPRNSTLTLVGFDRGEIE